MAGDFAGLIVVLFKVVVVLIIASISGCHLPSDPGRGPGLASLARSWRGGSRGTTDSLLLVAIALLENAVLGNLGD